MSAKDNKSAEKKIAVVAFGGNAILEQGEDGHASEQFRHAAEACDLMIKFIERGYELIVVHGNGPQVGNLLIQMEEAALKVPSFPLDVCVAMTQGSMGYMLENALANALRKHGIKKEVATVSCQVLVDRNDPRMKHATKPIGPFYSHFRAKALMAELNCPMIEDSGRGWRRVVYSPKPWRILADKTIRHMVNAGCVVIAGGGGGIPVYEENDGRLVGVEAVIDKDFTASLLARSVQADLFVVLTGVDVVYYNFRSSSPEPLPILKVSEARRFLEDGQFPPGSMGPKISAAIEFVEAGGKEVLITSAEVLDEALEQKAGTRIVPN